MLASLPVDLTFAFPQHTAQPQLRESMELSSLRITEGLGGARFPHPDPKLQLYYPFIP